MATRSKKSGKASNAAPFAGKTVAFVGTFGYKDMSRQRYQGWVVDAGGKVVDAEQVEPDCLVVGDGRGGKPPALVAKLQKQHPGMQVVDVTALAQMAVPTPDQLLAVIRSGLKKDAHVHWESLQERIGKSGQTIDLSGANLRDADVYGHLENVCLDGADLRKSSARYTHFGKLRIVKLDGADLSKAYFGDCEDCSFRNAIMTEAWIAFGMSTGNVKCDFTGAKLNQIRGGDKCRFVDCNLSQADLTDADVEGADFSRANLSGANLTRLHGTTKRYGNKKTTFDGANLSGATLFRADLRGASFVNADLRKADLREAALNEADLTGANVEGADFGAAVLTDAITKGVDFSRAKNYQAPVVRQAGPKLKELAAVAAASTSFSTAARVQIDEKEYALLGLHASGGGHLSARFDFFKGDSTFADDVGWANARSFEEGMINLLDRFPAAKLRLDTVTAKGSKTVRGAKLLELAVAAWAETAGITDAATDLAAHEAEREDLRETMLGELRGGRAGIKKWNARSAADFKRAGNFRGVDLAGAKMDAVKLPYCGGGHYVDFQRADFSGASLAKAELENARCQKANFKNANLQGAKLDGRFQEACFENADLSKAEITGVELGKANFKNANLRDATLRFVALKGADLTGADLTGASFSSVIFDGDTKFPNGFKKAEGLEWKGAGPNPFARKTAPAKGIAGLDFEGFMKRLRESVAEEKLKKSLKMLKADRFQLFAEVKEDLLVGIVKSQTDAELVYSCKLAADGAFGCGTQNLKPCGGLQGSLCKHLLVLIVGLAKASQLDPGKAAAWVQASHQQKPALDKDAMSETFLRYKGAEAGEVDWRPTETIPEDYYAM
jgi:uncharacterized protein YjbI with pentapeptide repeats